MIFRTLFWDDVTKICYDIKVNKLLIGPKQVFFLSFLAVKKVNNNRFSSQIFVTSSQNYVVPNGHEHL